MLTAIRSALSSKRDPDCAAWLNGLQAGGGVASGIAKAAVLQWFIDEKSGGANSPWPAIVAQGKGRVNFNLGDYASSKVPQIRGDGPAVDTFTGYSSADFTESGGLVGAGDGSKFIAIASGGAVSLQTDLHHWQYMTGGSAESPNFNQTVAGFGDAFFPFSDSFMYLDINDTQLRYTSSAFLTLPYGLVGFTYKNGSGVQMFQNAGSIASTSASFASVAGSSAQVYYKSVLPRKGYGFGLSMTAAQWAIHAAAVIRLNTTLGRA